MNGPGRLADPDERGDLVHTLGHWLSDGVILLPRGHLMMFGAISCCHNWRWGCYWHVVGKIRGAGEHLTKHGTTVKIIWFKMSTMLRFKSIAKLLEVLVHSAPNYFLIPV